MEYYNGLQAETDDDVLNAVLDCNRGNRPLLMHSAILELPLKDETINELIEDVWTDSESVYECQHIWNDVWYYYNNPYQKKLINRIFKQPIKLYRGGSLDGEYQSWTFSEEQAKFFAMRQVRSQDTIIHERYFNAEDVIAIFNSRGEKEVVIKVAI
tara:strand:- start:111 stop:578 length:468 start_codon:yes stop_codon:yes gene_type:complete